jgi:serine/threonine protein kinase
MSLLVAEGARLRSGRYELTRPLGRGGAATVWLAQDTLLERRVAVKILAEGLADDHAWLARFKREARIAAQLQHPNLVSIYDFEADVERPYLVMAYLAGGSLQDRLDNGGSPDPERLATDLLRALDHIHAAGIVHRDVKPANVLLARDGRACLTDFGVARPQDATSITQTGQIPGTARYMAPELWRGEEADERSDLFACGVLLSQCLDDESPARVSALVERLSAENRELRPASAAVALELLGAEQDTEPTVVERRVAPAIAAEPDLPAAEAAARAGHSGTPRWLPVAALCLVVLVAGIAIAGGTGGDDGEPTPDPKAESNGGNSDGGRAQDSATPPATTTDETPAPDPTLDGAALNDEGFSLIQQGRYDDAIPVLQQAVDALAENPEDINYAYALFNLGNALRLAGQPEDAIPILERRLEIPDQTETVKAELAAAKADLKEQEKAAKDD